MTDMQRLTDRVALVTGSSRGIGAAIARALATDGARVALHGRDTVALGGVDEAIRRGGGVTTIVTGDVTRFDEVERIRGEIEARLGPVDLLVANAGGNYAMPGPLEETPEDAWRATVNGNLTATYLTIRSFLPGMKQRRSGCIITISSTAARRPDARSPIAYAAAKAGIQMMTQHLAVQVGPHGIRVNCIAPDTILTERNRERIPDQTQGTLASAHALRRLGTPDDVAAAVVFLASDDASWITGEILDVAGGPVFTSH